LLLLSLSLIGFSAILDSWTVCLFLSREKFKKLGCLFLLVGINFRQFDLIDIFFLSYQFVIWIIGITQLLNWITINNLWCSLLAQVGCKIYVKNTDWLTTLLHSDFFDSCSNHQERRKNEKNVFCIDCSVGCCRHCMESHCLHRQLQICKYVYHDVVRLQEIQKHLDCSKIQVIYLFINSCDWIMYLSW